MKKTNFKLPGLPTEPATPKISTTTKPPSDSGVSKGFQNGATKPINFGKASRAATKNPPTSSAWTSLLSGTTSGGVTGALSSAAGFGGGIASLFSGLASLFGSGKTAPPALAAYQLPTSQDQTISTGSTVATPGVYGGPLASTPFSSQSSGQVVQAVKQALLNSSSLNDVIAEL